MRPALVMLLAALPLALPVEAAPLHEGAPALELRAETLIGQPTTLLGVRGGFGLGAGYRVTDQVALIGDVESRAAPRGGVLSWAAGLQATLDITPVSPYLELAVVQLTNREVLGYSLATRTGAGVDWAFARGLAVGAVARTYTAFDPVGNNAALAGFEVAVRLVFTPGAYR